MTDAAAPFLEKSRDLLRRDYLPKIERSLSGLSEADVWWRPNEASNSIGNLILHLCGNAGQWIAGGVGRRDRRRDRQREFDERTPIGREALLAKLRTTLTEVDEVLAAIGPAELLERRRIQGYDVTVLDAIYHVVEHFSMHTGQIIMLSKMRTGRDLQLWQPPAPPAPGDGAP